MQVQVTDYAAEFKALFPYKNKNEQKQLETVDDFITQCLALNTVLYIDLDAHQGDGVCHTYMQDKQVQIFDMYSEHNFPNDPVAQERIDWEIPVSGVMNPTLANSLSIHSVLFGTSS